MAKRKKDRMTLREIGDAIAEIVSKPRIVNGRNMLYTACELERIIGFRFTAPGQNGLGIDMLAMCEQGRLAFLKVRCMKKCDACELPPRCRCVVVVPKGHPLDPRKEGEHAEPGGET